MIARSRQDVITVIFKLLDENDAIEWRNDTAYTYLQGIADWLKRQDNEQISWQILADALLAARGER
jgi:hypothetical protein